MPKPSKRAVVVTGTILAAIEGGRSLLEELRDECQEVVDGLEERFSGTARYETMSSTVDVLDFVDDGEPELPDEAGDFGISYTEDQRKNLSRAARRDNAVNMLSAAADGLREWASQEQEDHQDDSDWDESDVTNAEEVADQLEEWVGNAEDAEFPGMMG